MFWWLESLKRCLSLYRPDSSDCLYPLPNKDWKMMKLKFSTEINIWKIQRIGHLITKKYRGWKYTSPTNSNMPPMTRVLHFSNLSCNSTFTTPPQKKNYTLIWAQLCNDDDNNNNNNLMTKLKIIKKFIIIIHSKMWESK
jgi:hypothetical protein